MMSTLSDKERSDLASDLASWHDKFGETALNEGLLPHAISRSVDSDEDKLQRLLDTKLAVAEVSRSNPDAIFSWENKYALMNEVEFKQNVEVSSSCSSAVVSRQDQGSPKCRWCSCGRHGGLDVSVQPARAQPRPVWLVLGPLSRGRRRGGSLLGHG
ncbi:Aste57867_20472 [Aphanomyces stellatus]|uniref:Aste57867_20472 protein n=1 Tax=Aphanomyces stellatus TaxID=120398 RepID=A0A485LGJ4_9STRA|nr:hypothetical protein As57867_020406 [Aphanomyces stellatus]VFT97158.1 Aste57867_20472 [Aphanomyces stellatus]